MESHSKVAVCVATKDRAELLRSCLKSVLGQDLPDDVRLQYLCVVDNSDIGSARQLVERLACVNPEIDIRYRHSRGGGYSSVRNALLDMVPSATDFFVFIDDDETAAPDWLTRLVHFAIRERLHLVAGPVETILPELGPSSWLVRRGHLRSRTEPAPNSVLPTGNLLVSTPAWRQTGLQFDPAFDATGGEDTDWTLGMLERGFRSGYCAQAKASETLSADRFQKAYWRRRAFRSGRSHWLRMAKRAPNSSRAILVFWSIGCEGLPRVASGSLWLLMALITRNHEGLWLGEARVLRGFGIVFEGLRSVHLQRDVT
jgi:succinoglycan biosynthesis protein ExoM